MTQVIAIMAVLCLALLALFVGWCALAISAREERDQQQWIETMAASGLQDWPADQASANEDYPAD